MAEANRHVSQNRLLHAMFRQLSIWQILEEEYRLCVKGHGHVVLRMKFPCKSTLHISLEERMHEDT